MQASYYKTTASTSLCDRNLFNSRQFPIKCDKKTAQITTCSQLRPVLISGMEKVQLVLREQNRFMNLEFYKNMKRET